MQARPRPPRARPSSTGPTRPAHRTAPSTARATPAIPLAVAIGCVVLVALQLRPGIVSIGPLLPSLIDEFHLTHTQASLLTAIPTLLMGLLAIPAPGLARRFGRDRTIIAALALLVMASAIRALANSTAFLFLATAGIGVGIAIAGVLIASFVKACYPGRAAIFMGVYATALALGSTASAAATGAMASAADDWRIAAGVWALPGLTAIAAWRFIAMRAPRPGGHGPDQTSRRYRMPLGNPTAWLIALFFACNNFVFYAYIAWLAPMYAEYGWDASRASLMLATFTLSFMAANPLFGILSRSTDRRVPLAISSAIALAGIATMLASPTALPYATVAAIAFGTGGAFTLAMTLPLDNAADPEEAESWNAFVMLVSYVVASTGPLAVGQLRDAHGGFQSSLWLIAAVSGVMLACTPFMQPHRRG